MADRPPKYVCPWCEEHDSYGGCWHSPQEWELAQAIQAAIGGEWGSDIDMAGSFLDDAEGIYPEVGEPPYAVVVKHPGSMDRWTALGVVNGQHLFGIPNEEGDAPAEYLADLALFGRIYWEGIMTALRFVSIPMDSEADRG